MSARVTFGNINGVNQSVPHVSLQEEEVPIVHSQPAQVTMDMHTRVMQLVDTIMYRLYTKVEVSINAIATKTTVYNALLP